MNIESLRSAGLRLRSGRRDAGVSGWASADPPSRVVRLGYMTGAVSFSPAGEDDWVQASINRPLTIGDRLWMDAGARAELQIGGAMLRINAGTSVTVLNLDDNIAQLQVTQGTMNVRVRRFDPNQVMEIDTPNLAFTVRQPGEYRIVRGRRRQCDGPHRAQRPGRSVWRRRIVCVDSRQPYRFMGTGLREYEPLAAPGIRRFRSLGDRSRPPLRHLALRPLCFAGRHRLSGPRCERNAGAPTRPTATSGSRLAWLPTGRLIATAIGPGSTPGVGRGWTTRPGASPCPTTAAGRTCAERGAGSPDRFARAPTMLRRWSRSSAATTSSSRSRAATSAASRGSRSGRAKSIGRPTR